VPVWRQPLVGAVHTLLEVVQRLLECVAGLFANKLARHDSVLRDEHERRHVLCAELVGKRYRTLVRSVHIEHSEFDVRVLLLEPLDQGLHLGARGSSWGVELNEHGLARRRDRLL